MPTEVAVVRPESFAGARGSLTVRSCSPEVGKQVTDVLDEIIPTIPIDQQTAATIARIGERLLKAASEEQASYETLLAAASAETGSNYRAPLANGLSTAWT